MARQCLECGDALKLPTKGEPKRGGRTAEFCCTQHRQAWNNRRMQCGAILYDLFMAHRYDRKTGEELGLLSICNRLGLHFREDDNSKRGGRRSWRKPQDVLDERPYLKAEIHSMRLRAGARTTL